MEVLPKVARVLLSVALAAIVLLVGSRTAGASTTAGASQPIGRVTCHASGSLSFNPPLTPVGTLGHQEKIALVEKLTRCQGRPGAHVPSSPQAVSTQPILLPASTVAGKKVVGDCKVLGSQLTHASTMQTIKWGGSFQEQKLAFTSRLMEEEGIYYFFQHTGGKHTLNVALGVASASSRSLQSCISGAGGRLARLSFDSSISSMTEGTTILTSGTLGGSNVSVGDQLSSHVVGGPNCSSVSAAAAVHFNPAVPGAATAQLTSLSFSSCTIDMGPGVGTVSASVVANHLPYLLTIGDGSGDPATLAGVSVTISVTGSPPSSCTYASPASLTGTYDNSTASITFGGSLSFSAGTGPLAANCPSASLPAPKFTSVADASRSGSPAVFVN